MFNPIPAKKRLNGLLQAREITPATYAIGDAILFRCRARGVPRARVSLSKLANLTGRARSTVQLAVARLLELGVIVRKRTYARVGWRVMRDANVYWFPEPLGNHTKTEGRPASPQIQKMLRKIGARWTAVEPIRTVAEQLRLLREG